MEAHKNHGPNVIIFQMVKSRRRLNVVGCYLVPQNASTLEIVVVAIGHRLRGAEILVAGDFNTNLESMDSKKSNKVIAATMETE